MKEISPADASRLVLLGQVDDDGKDLIAELSTEAAKEIGLAIVAPDSQAHKFSKDAWTAAQEIKWWRVKTAEQRHGQAGSGPGASAESQQVPGSRPRRAPSSGAHPSRTSR